MRPRHDVDHPEPPEADPYEVIAHLRESLAKWQATCQRLRAQRDAAEAHATRYLDALGEIAEMDWRTARDGYAASTAREALDEVDALGHRVPDSVSEVTG